MIGRLKRKYFMRKKPKYVEAEVLEKYIIGFNKFGMYCIPRESMHRPCAQTILAGKVHEEDTINAILHYSKGEAVAHAGTYFGDALPILSSYCRKVYAFEPNKENFRASQITIALNDLRDRNVSLKWAALGGGKGIAYLGIKSEGSALGGGSSITKVKFEECTLGGGGYVTKEGEDLQWVSMEKLDDHVMPNKVRVIHLDVEGYEMQVLKGAQRLIHHYSPVLILERYDGLVLKDLGYKRVGRVNENTIFERG